MHPLRRKHDKRTVSPMLCCDLKRGYAQSGTLLCGGRDFNWANLLKAYITRTSYEFQRPWSIPSKNPGSIKLREVFIFITQSSMKIVKILIRGWSCHVGFVCFGPNAQTPFRSPANPEPHAMVRFQGTHFGSDVRVDIRTVD